VANVDYVVYATIISKTYEKNYLEVGVLREDGVPSTFYAYGRSAKNLNNFLQVHNIYSLGIGSSPQGQPDTILSARRPWRFW